MAHQVLPQHRPHEQLRTEAPAQKTHTDKYVSAYVSSANFVDMSFSNPLLQESADHFRVGIDELTVNLAHLSMLEYDSGTNVLLRIRRLGHFGNAGSNPAQAADAAPQLAEHAGLPTADLAQALEFKITRQYNTLAEILERMKEICRALGTYIRTTGLVNPDTQNYDVANLATYQKWNVPIAANAASNGGVLDYLDVFLTTGGLLKFRGNKIFWSNFVIEIPEAKYRYLLLGDSTKRYISVHPSAGGTVEQYTDNAGTVVPFANWANIDRQNWTNATNLKGDFRTLTGAMNIANSLDRRVALEVGCSLPLKNSPMFDHGSEAPDFVLGRFHLQQAVTGDAKLNDGRLELDVGTLGPKQLQGPKDRVCYHHLGPQQKIQMLRLRLWARVRTYDAVNDKWGMKTIQMPAQGSDFWHVKLHFIVK